MFIFPAFVVSAIFHLCFSNMLLSLSLISHSLLYSNSSILQPSADFLRRSLISYPTFYPIHLVTLFRASFLEAFGNGSAGFSRLFFLRVTQETIRRV